MPASLSAQVSVGSLMEFVESISVVAISSSVSYYGLTLMLLVVNLADTKWCKKPGKWLKPWQMGTHLRVLSESFPMSTNMTGLI